MWLSATFTAVRWIIQVHFSFSIFRKIVIFLLFIFHAFVVQEKGKRKNKKTIDGIWNIWYIEAAMEVVFFLCLNKIITEVEGRAS